MAEQMVIKFYLRFLWISALFFCGVLSSWAQTRTGGGQGISFDPTTPAMFWVKDDFISGGTTANNIGDLDWFLQTIGSAPVIAVSSGVYPHLGIITLATAVAATQGQGGTLDSNTPVPLGDLSTNTNWTATWIFQLSQTAATRFRIGLGTGAAAVIPTTGGYFLRFDNNNPLSAGAITSVICTTAVCTVTMTGAHGLTLIGQTVTISGETCPTRNVNVANLVASITSTTVYTFNAVGAAETCTVQGTATSSADTTFKVEQIGTNNLTATTVTDTTVAADTNWHKIVMNSTVSGTVSYALDAGAPIVVSTNASTASMNPQVIMVTDATAQKTVSLDFFSMRMSGMAR